jgi:DNA-directed RNA polymerase specialized sigma24 family protein
MGVMAAGDFAAFYAGAYPGARRLAHLLLDGSPIADDLVHDAFSELHRTYAEDVDPEDRLRVAVVDRCAGRQYVDARPAIRPDPDPGPVEVRDPLLDAVHALPPRERIAVVLRYWAGLSDAALATTLGTGSPQVRALIGRALGRLDTGRGTGADLERDLGDALALEARTASLPEPEWTGPRPTAVGRSHRPVLATTAAVVVVVVAVVGLLAARPRPALVPAVARGGGLDTPFIVVGPDGVLPRVDPDQLEWAPQPFVVGPINPASFRVWRGGGAEYVTYQTIETRPGARVLEVWCVERQYREPSCNPFTAFQGVSMYDSLDDAGNRIVENAATAGALRCLAAAGLHSDPRRPVPRGLDVRSVWRRCVGKARDGAKLAFEQLGGRVVDNRVDDPSIVAAD